MLYAMRYFERAALLAEACIEVNALDLATLEVHCLCEAIFLEYARVLYGLEYVMAAEYYANKSGENGKKLLEEFRSKQEEIDSNSDMEADGKEKSLFQV